MGKYSVIRWMQRIAWAAVLCTASNSAFAEGAGAWIAAKVSGSVSQSGANGSWQEVVAGSVLVDGAHVRTGVDAKLVLSHLKDIVTVSPNSDFELPHDGGAGNGPSVLQTLGTLLFRIEHTPGRRFEVDAPYLAAVVKGTVFTVSASASGNSVHVTEGAVEVTTRRAQERAQEVVLVRPGQTAIVPSSGRDMSITGGQGHGRDREAPRRIESGDPGSPGEAGKNKIAPALTRTLGEEHLDVRAASGGLLEGGDRAPGGRRVAVTTPGTAGMLDAAEPAGAGGTDSAGNSAVAGSNPNAAGGNPNAAGGNPNAAGGNPNAAGGNPNAAGGNPNAAAGNANAAAGKAIAAANKAKGLAKP